MVWRTYIREHPQFGGWFARVERQPSWPIRAAVFAGVLVVVVPLVLVTVAALMVAAAVFLFASLIARVLALFNGGAIQEPVLRDDGRDNVRVIQNRQ